MGNHSRPTPIRAAAKSKTWIAVAGAAVSGLVMLGVLNADQAGAINALVAALGVAGATIVPLATSVWHAFSAARKGEKATTPMVDPRDTDGVPMQRVQPFM